MELTKNRLFLLILSGAVSMAAGLFAAINLSEISIWVYVIAVILLIYSARLLVGSYSNLTILFLLFFFLYSFSGAVAVTYGDGLHRMFLIANQTDAYIMHQSFANV